MRGKGGKKRRQSRLSNFGLEDEVNSKKPAIEEKTEDLDGMDTASVKSIENELNNQGNNERDYLIIQSNENELNSVNASNNESKNQVTYPLIIIKPIMEHQNHKSIIDNEITQHGFKSEDIVSIGYTSAKNLIIQFSNRNASNKLMNLGTFLGGQVHEIRRVQEERSIVIRGSNVAELSDYKDQLREIGIVDFKDLDSIKRDNRINMVIAVCDSIQTASQICTVGYIFLGYIKRSVRKFVLKLKIIVCFNCGSTEHIAKNCKHTGVCIVCSSKDHTKKDCPHKGQTDRTKIKCPNCHGNHPATYGGCVEIKNKLKKLHEKKMEHQSYNPSINLLKDNHDSQLKKPTYASVLTSTAVENALQNQMDQIVTTISANVTSSLNKFMSDLSVKGQIWEDSIVNLKTSLAASNEESKERFNQIRIDQAQSNNRIVMFINEIFHMLPKAQDFEMAKYNAKLNSYFNLSLDGNKKLISSVRSTEKSSLAQSNFDIQNV